MSNHIESSKKVAKNTLYLFFRMIMVMAVGLYTSRIVLSTLGVEDYGIYNVVGSVVILFSFLKQAMTNATYRFFAYALGENDVVKLRKTFVMSINAHLLIIGVILLLSETVGLWLLNTKLVFPEDRLFAANIAYQFSIFSFCVNVLQTPYNSVVIAHEQMSFFALTSIWEVFLKLGIVFLLLVLPGDVLVLYALLMFVISLFLYLWYIVYCHRRYQECRYSRYWDGRMLISMVKYSGWSVLVNGADVLVTQSIVFFFNIFFGVAMNAALGVANQVCSALQALLGSFTQAFNPQIIKSYAKGEMGYLYKLIYSTSKISYFLLLFVAVPVLLNIDFLLGLWLEVIPEGVDKLLVMIVLFSLIDAYSAPLWITVYATGNLRTHQLLMSIIKIFNVPLAYLVLKNGGDAWMALALKAGLNLVCSIVRPIYMRRLVGLPLHVYVREVFGRIVIVSVLSLPLPVYLASIMPNSWGKLLMVSFVSIVVMVMVVLYIGLNKQEKTLCVAMLRKYMKNKFYKGFV